MATNTTNYNWTKPDYEDDADIKDLNDNFDGIDAQVKAIDDQVQLNKNNISYNTAMGVKNLFNNVATASSGNRVYYTPNADKSGTIATESSGAAAPVYFDLGTVTLPSGTYVLSGGVSSDVSLRSSDNTYVDEGNGATITLSQSATISLRIRVASGYTNINGITVYPMIRNAIITDTTYQPYALSNAELTTHAFSKIVFDEVIGNPAQERTYQMKTADFGKLAGCGIYMIYIISWGQTPNIAIYTAGYSGGIASYSVLQKVTGTDRTISISGDTITINATGRVQIVALQ